MSDYITTCPLCGELLTYRRAAWTGYRRSWYRLHLNTRHTNLSSLDRRLALTAMVEREVPL